MCFRAHFNDISEGVIRLGMEAWSQAATLDDVGTSISIQEAISEN